MSRVWRFSVAAAFVMMACPARAQSPLGALSQFKPVALDTRGDAAPLPSFILTAPLRLALQNDILPCRWRLREPVRPAKKPRATRWAVPLAAFPPESCAHTPADARGVQPARVPHRRLARRPARASTTIRSSLALCIGAGIIIAPGPLPLYGNLPNAVARQVRGRTRRPPGRPSRPTSCGKPTPAASSPVRRRWLDGAAVHPHLGGVFWSLPTRSTTAWSRSIVCTLTSSRPSTGP